jgi:hypothetical protein
MNKAAGSRKLTVSKVSIRVLTAAELGAGGGAPGSESRMALCRSDLCPRHSHEAPPRPAQAYMPIC